MNQNDVFISKQAKQIEIYSEEYLLEVNEYKPDKTIFKCFICDKQFTTEFQFRQHFNRDQESLDFTCTACSAQFQFKKEFLVHKCDYIDFDDPIIRANDINNVDYFCKFCSLNHVDMNPYQTYLDYTNHLDKVHNFKDIIHCSICKHVNLNLNDYLKHLNLKHDIINVSNECQINELNCNLCNFSTNQLVQLKAHLIKMHLANKLIETRRRLFCTQCKCLFQYQHDFNLHLFEHIRKQANCYYCPICLKNDELFHDLDSFNKHVNKTHSQFKCGLCCLCFSDGKSFETHLISNHLNDLLLDESNEMPSTTLLEVENIYCFKCKRYFASSTCLAIHLKKQHDSQHQNAWFSFK